MNNINVHLEEGDNVFEKYFHLRIKQNKNVLIAITGPTGSGKTYASIRLAERMAKLNGVEFDERFITFDAVEFMEVIQSGIMKKGSILILDEAGVAINSRRSQTNINVLIGYVAQTFRHRNYIVVFNVPDFAFIDSAVRRMVHVLLETTGIDYKEKLCYTKPLLIQNNQRSGKLYFKFLRYSIKGKGYSAVDRWAFEMPSKKLLKAYELKKSKFTSKLNADVLRSLKADEYKTSGRKELTDKQKEVWDLNQQGLNQTEIAERLGMMQANVSQHLSAIRKKGYNVLSAYNGSSSTQIITGGGFDEKIMS